MKADSKAVALLKTLTVLYVEDDLHAQEEIGVFLRRRVGTLITAPDGAEGLAAFAQHRPHIVITDIQMPRMDGLTLVQKLRELDRAVPVIVTTAYEQTDLVMRSLALNIDRYLLKPIQGSQLEAALVQCALKLFPTPNP